MENANILVVEDDADINRLLCTILEGAGYTCRSAFSGSEALLWAEKYDYDLIVLDLMLPGVTGEELIARIRRGKTMPIIVASAKVGVPDRVNVLKLGADDFIPKPFDLEVLSAKVQALLRRTYDFGGASPLLESRGAVLDTGDNTLTYQGQKLELTRNEYRILQVLLEQKGRTVSRDTLMRKLWETDSFVDENTLTVNMTRLRGKLAALGLPGAVKTRRGMGYQL